MDVATPPGSARRRSCTGLLLLSVFLCLVPAPARPADLTDLEEVVDESRLTFARFVGDPSMGWFRDRARQARAVFIAPRITRAAYLFGASWGTGVLLVRDSSTGRWSQPAFYQISGMSVGFQIGALRSEMVALASDDQAAAEMVDGAFTVGLGGSVGLGRYGGGLGGSLDISSGRGFITASAPAGFFAGIAAGANLALVRHGANELYYGRPVGLEELRHSLVTQWYSDRLVNTLTDLTASEPEPRR